MDRKPLPIGVDIFEHLRTKNYYYVDKTNLIRDLIDHQSGVNLFTRPRRFGKTLNMSMLQYFFEDMRDDDGNKIDNSHLFDGLNIMNAGERYISRLGQYPVIFLTLKDTKLGDFEASYAAIKMVISMEYSRHRYLLDSDLPDEDKEACLKIIRREADDSAYQDSLRFLSACLEKYYGKKTIILIDEYDVPLENSFVRHFYDQMVNLIRTMFSAAFKTNPSLEFAVITGCLRISKESIFTGMNNLNVISILNKQYDEYFGFTEPEVKEMCAYYGVPEKYETIQKWYDGYVFGGAEIYNPWSVLKYFFDVLADRDCLPRPYWANTSSNSIVRTLIDRSDDSARSELEILISGGTIEKEVHEDITYGEIYDNLESLWNFMFFTGYFRKVSDRYDDYENKWYLTLRIPNTEVKTIFRDHIRSWFSSSMKQRDLSALHNAFLQKDVPAFENELNDILLETISSFDEHESYYHGLVSGILTGIKGYIVKSNRESGAGRSDLVVKPVDRRKEAFILEFKVTKGKGSVALEKAADEALAQIAEKQYDRELEDEYYTIISHYGIAFRGKECSVKLA